MKIKKTLLALAMVLFGRGFLLADSTTSRWGLTIIDVGSTNWGPKINTNSTLIDNAAGIALSNTFTSSQTFNSSIAVGGQALFGNGTLAAPSISFTNFNGSGWRPATGGIFQGIVAGSKVFEVGSSSVTSSQPIYTANLNVTSSGTLATATINSLKASTLGSNLAAGNFKITGLSTGSASTDSVAFSQLNPGKILQMVVISTSNAQKTSTNASYATTGLSGTITATSATSQVIVLVMQNFGASGTAGTVCTARVHYDSSDIITPGDYTVHVNGNTAESDSGVALIAKNTPGDTSSHTYSTTFARTAGSGTCIANSTTGSNTGAGAYMLLLEIGQ